MARLYTKVGDRGTTRLVGGGEVPKDHPRIEAYGTVDELNAVLGLLRHDNRAAPGTIRNEVDARLERIQHDLFTIGSDLATPVAERWEGMHRIGPADVARLEGWIDDWSARVPPLRQFILPGGGAVGARAHLARTVCRRAERRVRSLAAAEPDEVGAEVLVYLNRLSDLLFVLARLAAHAAGEPEVTWKQPG